MQLCSKPRGARGIGPETFRRRRVDRLCNSLQALLRCSYASYVISIRLDLAT